jgi:RNA polymerase sigma factor (sigma-70 family)
MREEESRSVLALRDPTAPATADGRFEELFGRHRDGLAGYCRNLVDDEDDVNDVLQNVALCVLLAFRRGVRPSRERAWLYRIAHNEAVNLHRRRAAADRAEQERPAASDGPESAALVKEKLVETLEDVGALRARPRQVILMHELSGLSREEIAARLGLSPEAVSHELSQARARLRADRTAREIPCEAVRATLSARDGRRRGRAEVRAHLRGCQACRAWQSSGGRTGNLDSAPWKPQPRIPRSSDSSSAAAVRSPGSGA